MDDPLLVLPPELSRKSISKREVALPLGDALLAIDILASNSFHILGWEGWVKSADGRVGHGSAGHYAGGPFESLTPNDAANRTKEGIVEDAASWAAENVASMDSLHFCITAHRIRS